MPDDSHVNDVALLVRDRQRQRQKRVEGVAVVLATGTGQRRPVERLEQVVDETVVATRMVRQRFGGHDFVRTSNVTLQRPQRRLSPVGKLKKANINYTATSL